MLLIIIFLLLFSNTFGIDIIESDASVSSYGSVIKSNSNVIVVGDPSINSVFLYDITSGAFLQKLTENELSTNDNYGGVIDCDDTYIVIGALGKQKIYIYEYISGNWTLKTSIIPSVLYQNGDFGISFSLFDDKLAIAYPGKRVFSYDNAGSVEVYHNLGYGWAKIYTLIHNDYAQITRFGAEVSYKGNTIFASRENQDRMTVFKYSAQSSSWTQPSELLIPSSTIIQSDSFLILADENTVNLYTTYNLHLVTTITTQHNIKSISLTDDYFTIQTSNNVSSLYKKMYGYSWQMLTTYDSKQAHVNDNVLLFQKEYNELESTPDFTFTDRPSTHPTQSPSKSPTLVPRPTRSPTPTPTPLLSDTLLYGGIIIPCIILVFGIVIIYIYKNRLQLQMSYSPKYNYVQEEKYLF